MEVHPKDEFTAFRTQDVGEHGHLQRVAGKRSTGSWSTATWLINKEDAHVEGGKLIPDTKDAKDRPNVPERAKPTPAQMRARRENIKKAQAARNSNS